MYTNYIGVRPTWLIFFPHPHGTSRAPPSVCAPHFGEHWSRKAKLGTRTEKLGMGGKTGKEGDKLGMGVKTGKRATN
jgi:hypothetical protein